MTTGRINQVGQPLLRIRPGAPEGHPERRAHQSAKPVRAPATTDAKVCGSGNPARRSGMSFAHQLIGDDRRLTHGARFFRPRSAQKLLIVSLEPGRARLTDTSYRNVSEDIA
jgi:hypothetical protein